MDSRPDRHLPPTTYHLPAVRRIAVLGGGISGLTAAYTLAQARRAGAPIEGLLIEGSGRLGGLIRTEQVEGFVVEAGPDSFLAEKPEAASLCRELGLGDSLLGSNDRERRTYILHQGRLVPLPDGLQLFVPTRLWPVLKTPLLPARTKLAILVERFAVSPSGGVGAGLVPALGRPQGAPLRNQTSDESVASFVRRHFGSGMLENIVDPLLAGIFGGDSACLSVRSVLPRFQEMERQYGSLTRAARAAKRQHNRRDQMTLEATVPGSSVAAASRHVGAQGLAAAAGTLHASPAHAPPLFMTLEDGLEQLVEALNKYLESSHVHLGQRVIGIEMTPHSRVGPGGTFGSVARTYIVRCEGGTAHEADAIILALPTYECSRILSCLDPTLAETLAAIPYSSALTVALGYDARASGDIPSGFGFLVPQKEKRRLLACTFVHGKFEHRVPPGRALLRCFLGGVRDPDVLNLDDDEIISIVRRELQTILKLSAEPLFYRVYRWPSSMPQYVVGHQERIKAIQRQLENHPGLFFAGNAYSGIGISDCIRTGKAAAEKAGTRDWGLEAGGFSPARTPGP